MECEKCGRQYESNEIYCRDCGSKLIHKNVASDSTDPNKGKTSEFVFMLFGFVSLIVLLISTVIAFNLDVNTCDRFLLFCEEDLQVLVWWMIGALSAFLTVISFFVLILRRGNIKKLYVVLLLVVIVAVGGSCFSNCNQITDEAINYQDNVETVRQQGCVEKLKHANDRVNEAPDNIDYIVRLASIQQDTCLDFESAHENYEKAVSLYESKQETSEDEKHSYLNALERLLHSPHESRKLSLEINEKCPSPVNRDADGNLIPVTQDRSCIDPLVAEFNEERKEKYQSKIDDVLNILYKRGKE